MSYEEARKDRRRNRKAMNLQTYLALLSNLGRTIQAEVHQSRNEKSRMALEELQAKRQNEMLDRRLEHDTRMSRERNETSLEEARIRSSNSSSGNLPEWLAEAYGSDSGGDLDEQIAKLEAELQGISGLDTDPSVGKGKLDQISKLRALKGYRAVGGDKRTQLRPQMTGDQDKNPSVPQQSRMGTPGPGPTGGNVPRGTQGMTPIGGAQEQQARAYARLGDSYRRFLAKDPSGFHELQQLFGGALSEPTWYQSAMQPAGGGPMRPVQPMGTTVSPQ